MEIILMLWYIYIYVLQSYSPCITSEVCGRCFFIQLPSLLHHPHTHFHYVQVKGARSTTDPKKLGKTGKKRQHPKSSAAKTGLDAASTVTSAGTSKPRTKKSNKIASNKTLGLENPSVSKLGHAKPSKVKKRRGKKQLHSQEDEDANPMVVEGGAEDDGSRMGREDLLTAVQGNVTEDQGHLTGNGFGGGLEVTAVQLGIGEGAVSPSVSKNRRASRAEERKLEIERKRLERRELERLRKQAEEEERRLKVRTSRMHIGWCIDRV